MRGIGKTALFTVVAMLGWAGCGGPMEQDSSAEQEQQAGDVSALHDQVCPNVKASPDILWPPNHKFHLVTLSGANSITIKSVKQDEALDARGDGHTTPDAMLVQGHKNQVELRAERSGQGDGRVYCISFTAKDNQGKTCKGTALVGVPHDQGKGSTPVDSGCDYDSLGD